MFFWGDSVVFVSVLVLLAQLLILNAKMTVLMSETIWFCMLAEWRESYAIMDCVILHSQTVILLFFGAVCTALLFSYSAISTVASVWNKLISLSFSDRNVVRK